MILKDIFVFLYPLVPAIGLAGYIPQIIAVAKCEGMLPSFSLRTWSIWLATWVISLGYGVLHLQDFMFSLTAGMNVLAAMTLMALVVYKRTRMAATAVKLSPSG